MNNNLLFRKTNVCNKGWRFLLWKYEMNKKVNKSKHYKFIKNQNFSDNSPFNLESKGIIHTKMSNFLYFFNKRLCDIFFSFIAIIILSPLLIIIAIIIKVEDHGSVIYKANRIGRIGKLIKVTKFRSMLKNAEKLENLLNQDELTEYYKNYKLDYDPRITKFGGFLRKTSIDELPQLFDIFVGKMSIVGPRPVLEEETQLYGVNRSTFLSVKPGLTGLWQAYGRSNITYESGKRQEMELYYVRNKSFFLDIRIIFKTISVVLKGTGAK